MIGWRRCSDCKCVDEDDCVHSPKNTRTKEKMCTDLKTCIHIPWCGNPYPDLVRKK